MATAAAKRKAKAAPSSGVFSKMENITSGRADAKDLKRRATPVTQALLPKRACRDAAPSAAVMQTRMAFGQRSRQDVVGGDGVASVFGGSSSVQSHMARQSPMPTPGALGDSRWAGNKARRNVQSFSPRRPTTPQGARGAPAPSPSPSSSAAATPPRTGQLMGFANLGNTCYMSAVLSALLRQGAFSDAVLSTYSLYRKKGEKEGILPFLAESVRGIHSGGAVGIRPDQLKDAVAAHNTTFHGNEQQDAHEFMMSFLQLLHDEVLRLMLQFKPPQPAEADVTPQASEQAADSQDQDDEDGLFGTPPADEDDDDDASKGDAAADTSRKADPKPPLDLFARSHAAAEERERLDRVACAADVTPSLVRRLLEGQIAKKHQCLGCGAVTLGDTHDIFCAVSLPVVGGARMQDSLERLLAEEVVERDCSRKGRGCDEPTRSRMSSVFCTLPHYLLLHANRFSSKAMGVRKESDPMHVDACLDLDSFVDDNTASPAHDAISFTSEGDLRCRRPLGAGLGAPGAAPDNTTRHMYSLRAVVHHLGVSAQSGHYVTDFLDATSTWQRADDCSIHETHSPAGRESTSCYILVYERVLKESDT